MKRPIRWLAAAYAAVLALWLILGGVSLGKNAWYAHKGMKAQTELAWQDLTGVGVQELEGQGEGVWYVSTDTDPQLLEMAAVYKLPLSKRLRYIWLPGVFPSFSESCIAAMGMCWKSGVSAEVIGLPDHSVGDALYRAKITLSTPDVFAWTLVIVLLSAALSALSARGLRAAKKKLCGEVAA